MTRRFTQILVCLFVCFTFEDILAAEPLAQSILVIDQSEPNSPISRPMRNAFRSVLYSNADVARTVYLEPLNIQRFRGARYWEITYNYLKEKYRDKQIDLVIAYSICVYGLLRYLPCLLLKSASLWCSSYSMAYSRCLSWPLFHLAQLVSGEWLI